MKLLTELPIQSTREGTVFDPCENTKGLRRWGDWNLVTWLQKFAWDWSVIEDDGRKVLEHPTEFAACIRAGDGTWEEFTLEFAVRQLRPLSDTTMDDTHTREGRCGVMFRYLSYRQNYALVLESLNRVVLYRRDENNWIPLVSHEFEVDRARYYRFKVECKGDNILCWMDDEPLFDVIDSTFRQGRVAVFASTLSRFGYCRVYADEDGTAMSAAFISSETRAAAKSAEGLAKPVLWAKIPDVVARAFDISPDGRLHGALSIGADLKFKTGVALIAHEMDGSIRWKHEVTKAAAPLVTDLDGDGVQEVVLYDGPIMKLLDIRTGKTKVEKPTPPCNERGNRGGRENQLPYVPLYSMYLADVRGNGTNRDVILKDVCTACWVLDDKLDLLWWRSRDNGHDIGRYDIDGDGRDEIMLGYEMLDHDGTLLWVAEGAEYLLFTHDHADRVMIGEFDDNPDNGVEIALACGNHGFMLLDQNGQLRAHHEVGHAQRINVGKFRSDLPGLQYLVGCRWGNPGTRAMFSGSGDPLWVIEPDNGRAHDRPLRWAKDRDVFIIITTPAAGGLYDGYGRKVVPFPEAEICLAEELGVVGDFTGNGLDDFAVQAKDGVYIFTQGDMA